MILRSLSLVWRSRGSSTAAFARSGGLALAITCLLAPLHVAAQPGAGSGDLPVTPPRIGDTEPQPRAVTPRQDDRRSEQPGSRTLFREGNQLHEVEGIFDTDGEGITFIDGEGHQFGALKNLNLQRIHRVLRDENKAVKVMWTITGLITEFEGKHYLLIHRAIQKNSTVAPREIRDTTVEDADPGPGRPQLPSRPAARS